MLKQLSIGYVYGGVIQLASSRAEEELVDRQAQEGRERAEGLERELRETRREAAALKGQLAATEEVTVHIHVCNVGSDTLPLCVLAYSITCDCHMTVI